MFRDRYKFKLGKKGENQANQRLSLQSTTKLREKDHRAYKCVKSPHVTPTNMDPGLIHHLRWLELGTVCHLLVVVEDS
jgi:hypothetical protein